MPPPTHLKSAGSLLTLTHSHLFTLTLAVRPAESLVENRKGNENGKNLPLPPKHHLCLVNSPNQSQVWEVRVVIPMCLHSDVSQEMWF